MKIHNAISLLELQTFLREHQLNITNCHYVVSANCWCVTLRKEGYWSECSGIGRDVGEALKNAFDKYSEVTT